MPKVPDIDESNPPINANTVDQLKEYIEKTSAGLVGRIEGTLKGLNKPQWKSLVDEIYAERGVAFSDSRAKAILLDAGAKEKAGAQPPAQTTEEGARVNTVPTTGGLMEKAGQDTMEHRYRPTSPQYAPPAPRDQ